MRKMLLLDTPLRGRSGLWAAGSHIYAWERTEDAPHRTAPRRSMTTHDPQTRSGSGSDLLIFFVNGKKVKKMNK